MSTTMPALAFAGIGLMGLPMCRRLLAAGYPLTLWNRNADKCLPLLQDGCQRVQTPAELCRDAELVLLCLADTAAVREVVFGEGGIVEGARPGQLLIDFSSLEPAATREMAAELLARRCPAARRVLSTAPWRSWPAVGMRTSSGRGRYCSTSASA